MYIWLIGEGWVGWCLVWARWDRVHRKGHRINSKTLVTSCPNQPYVFKVMLNSFDTEDGGDLYL
jgi:hypothetical protein